MTIENKRTPRQSNRSTWFFFFFFSVFIPLLYFIRNTSAIDATERKKIKKLNRFCNAHKRISEWCNGQQSIPIHFFHVRNCRAPINDYDVCVYVLARATCSGVPRHINVSALFRSHRISLLVTTITKIHFT